MRFAVLAGLVVASLAVPAVARAAGPAFGGAGQLVISDDQPLGGGSVGASGSGTVVPAAPGSTTTASFQFATVSKNGGSGTEFSVAPAADFFVIQNLSVGGNILFGVFNPAQSGSGPSTTATLFGIAPRVGYNIPLTDMISFWPKVYFSYTTVNLSSGGGSAGGNATAIGLFAPIMFVPAPHFFLGIGPDFSTQLSSNSTFSGSTGGVSASGSTSNPTVTQVGIQATIGGWFLGD
jgi:hypothetical protein